MMTPEQQKWLEANPRYSPVRPFSPISLKRWADQGWLFGNGRFAVDDGQTLFPHAYPSWFKVKLDDEPVRVGRHYEMV